MDERFVSVQVKGRGQLVFSACSHAGIVNVLTHARATFPAVPLWGAMGGLHLSGSTEAIIPATVADLARFELGVLAPGHCTGWRAMAVWRASSATRSCRRPWASGIGSATDASLSRRARVSTTD